MSTFSIDCKKLAVSAFSFVKRYPLALTAVTASTASAIFLGVSGGALACGIMTSFAYWDRFVTNPSNDQSNGAGPDDKTHHKPLTDKVSSRIFGLTIGLVIGIGIGKSAIQSVLGPYDPSPKEWADTLRNGVVDKIILGEDTVVLNRRAELCYMDPFSWYKKCEEALFSMNVTVKSRENSFIRAKVTEDNVTYSMLFVPSSLNQT